MKKRLFAILCIFALTSILTNTQAQTMRTVYEFSVKDRKGKDVSLKAYANEVLLIVNTATKCGFTPQYDELEALYKKYHSQGFEVLDFPCNQFGSRHQAPTRAYMSSAN